MILRITTPPEIQSRFLSLHPILGAPSSTLDSIRRYAYIPPFLCDLAASVPNDGTVRAGFPKNPALRSSPSPPLNLINRSSCTRSYASHHAYPKASNAY